MARIKREASVILFDIGRSSTEQVYANGQTYFDNARSCVSMILQRKLFANKNDVVGLFLLGTEETENSLNYDNITLKFPLDPVNWAVLEFIEKEMKSTHLKSDWLSAIVLGMHYLKDETEDQPMITARKLILFSSFASTVDEDQVDMIINGMKVLGIELIIIGPKIMKKEDDEPASLREQGETLISKVIEQVGGTITSFDEAVPLLQFIEVKKIKPTPWNVVMDIGPDIKIRVSGYKKIAEATLPSWKISSNQDGGPAIAMERSFVKQDADQTSVNKDDVISGYYFGSTIVPFSDVDDSILKYKSGGKCLSVLGFTDSQRIPTHILVGEGVYYFVAPASDKVASVALSSFIGALHEKNMVAVVRKIYRDGLAPTVGVLIPKIRPNYECLVYVDLPYSEDVRTFMFPSLSKAVNPSEQQLECVDKLIDNMDLMTAGIDEEENSAEAFHPKRNLDPYHQHFYAALCERGLNPDKPLPPIKQTTLDLLKSPFSDKPECMEALKELKEQFPLVRIVQKEPRKRAQDVFKQDGDEAQAPVDQEDAATALPLQKMTMAEITSTTTVEIGTVNPVKDFHTILKSGQIFDDVARQMAEVILNLVLGSFGSDDFDKAGSALGALREKCISSDSAPLYNDWLSEFKDKILSRGKTQFWEIVTRDKLSLISNNESASSSINADAAAEFLAVPEEKVTERAPDEDMDIEDLLN